MARNMNWALDPRKRKIATPSPDTQVEKKTRKSSTTKKEEE